MSAQDNIPVLSSIQRLAGGYDAMLCDIWGVIHNGERPFEDAVLACQSFRKQGGTVVLISNSPRPGNAVALQLSQIGVPEDIYDGIVTSGDTTRHVLVERRGLPVFHLGPERDKPLLDGLELELVGLEEAAYVLCSGLYDDLTESPEDYTDMFSRMRARNLAMVCANPDIQVERGDRLIYCAGALAEAFEKRGGEVVYTGKPHRPIYEMAIARIEEARGEGVPADRILCIGDSLKTDITGAVIAGLDVVFVASALHIDGSNEEEPLSERVVNEVFSGVEHKPIAAQKTLKW